VDHAVRADQGLGPSFSAEEIGLKDEGDGLGQQVVEVLNGDLDTAALVDEDGVSRSAVLTESGEPIA